MPKLIHSFQFILEFKFNFHNILLGFMFALFIQYKGFPSFELLLLFRKGRFLVLARILFCYWQSENYRLSLK